MRIHPFPCSLIVEHVPYGLMASTNTFHDISELSGDMLQNPVICLGTFDGVHLGHKMLLNHLNKRSVALDSKSIVISFQPPPKSLLQGVRFLSSYEEKLELLSTFDLDAIVLIPFDFDYAKTDKQVFLEQIKSLNPKEIIVGEDFRFGHKRQGGIEDLHKICGCVERFDLLDLEGQPIKSSYIRLQIQEANVQEAARFLGHDYFAIGTVQEGQKRGRSIGYPTANIMVADKKALPNGVFAVEVESSYGRHYGMANVGARPSFEEQPPSLEVHVFDFSETLYEQPVTVYFKHFLRSQIKFAGIEEVKAQLIEDERNARDVLGI